MTTVANLITRIRERVDMPTAGYVTDANLVLMISDSACALDDMLIATYDDYKVTLSGALTISGPTATSNFFALPTSPAFLKSRAVYRVEGSNIIPLERAAMSEVYSTGRGDYRDCGLFYRIEGANCWIEPWASSAGSYRMRYIPAMTALTATSDSLAAHMDNQAWHAFITEDVSAKILMKQDLDASQFLALRAEAKQRIIDAAKPRDAGPPKRARDSRGVMRSVYPGWRRYVP